MTPDTINCYRINYPVDYWANVANKVGSECCAPVGAVRAVNALCDEVVKLQAALKMARDALNDWAACDLDEDQCDCALTRINEVLGE